MEKIKQIFAQSFWQVLGKAFSSISTLLVLGVISRSYGESGTGVYTLTITYLSFFFLAADLGLNAYFLPRLSESRNVANNLFSLRLLWSLVLVFISLTGSLLLPVSEAYFKQAVYLGSAMIVFYGISNSINLIFQSRLRYDLSILSTGASSLITLLFVYYLSRIGATTPYLILGALLGWIFNNLISSILVLRFHQFKITEVNFGFILKTIREAWPISLTLLLNVIYFRIDTFILSSYYPIAVIGNYNLAYMFFQTALVLPTFIMNGFYPLMIKQLKEDKFKFIREVKLASLGMIGIGILGTMVTWISAPFLIKIVSGGGFIEAVASLKILSLGFPAYFLSALLMWVLVTLNKFKTVFFVYLAGLAVNLILNFYFIPKYSLFAAAYITGISEYLILILQLYILYRWFGQQKLQA